MNILNDISDEFEMEFEIANKIIYKRKLLVQYITKNFYKEKTFASTIKCSDNYIIHNFSKSLFVYYVLKYGNNKKTGIFRFGGSNIEWNINEIDDYQYYTFKINNISETIKVNKNTNTFDDKDYNSFYTIKKDLLLSFILNLDNKYQTFETISKLYELAGYSFPLIKNEIFKVIKLNNNLITIIPVNTLKQTDFNYDSIKYEIEIDNSIIKKIHNKSKILLETKLQNDIKSYEVMDISSINDFQLNSLYEIQFKKIPYMKANDRSMKDITYLIFYDKNTINDITNYHYYITNNNLINNVNSINNIDINDGEFLGFLIDHNEENIMRSDVEDEALYFLLQMETFGCKSLYFYQEENDFFVTTSYDNNKAFCDFYENINGLSFLIKFIHIYKFMTAKKCALELSKNKKKNNYISRLNTFYYNAWINHESISDSVNIDSLNDEILNQLSELLNNEYEPFQNRYRQAVLYSLLAIFEILETNNTKDVFTKIDKRINMYDPAKAFMLFCIEDYEIDSSGVIPPLDDVDIPTGNTMKNIYNEIIKYEILDAFIKHVDEVAKMVFDNRYKEEALENAIIFIYKLIKDCKKRK